MIEKKSSMAIVFAQKNNKINVLILNNEGEWVFPKGHVEQNETDEECAIRELKEESGVSVNIQNCLGQVDEFRFYFDGEKAVKVIKVFAFIINNEQEIIYQKEEGFIDGKWVDTDTAVNLLKHDDAKNAFKKALDKCKSNELNHIK